MLIDRTGKSLLVAYVVGTSQWPCYILTQSAETKGSCLLLSEKVNDCGKEIISKTLEVGVQSAELFGVTSGKLNSGNSTSKLADKYIGAEKHEIKECEFDVYSALEFNLFLPKSDFILHLDRLGDLLNRTSVSSKSSSPSK